ncbi:hypothetical protein YYC_05800 [Plasmodium yoelii 17X]|uniref:Uncharacterized protein n=2 Tax=Plasmodium yoelii TaxID=5861 RepID=Q7R8U7_PLAYO|nr:hypothetical protein [Plasmodium yoelii yoelii]ETB56371.1 hypothetical protein YYC_05800 [Plasmodium yoelii 17X]
MGIKIDEMRKLYELLNELCNAITNYTNDSSNCPDFLKFANNWEEQFNQLYCDVLLTLKNTYEKLKNDNNNPSELPKLKEIEEINDYKKLCKEATNSLNGKTYLEKGEDTLGYIDVVKNTFETYSSFFSIIFTNIGNNLYEKTLSTIKNFYCKFINFAGIIISYVNEQLKKGIGNSILDKGIPEQKGPGGEPLSGQENSSEKGSYNQKNDQGEPQKNVPKHVVRPRNPETEVTGNGTTEIVFLIPITLAIMYKVNKTTKTVINSTDGKKQIQIIINSSGQIKQTKKSINSVYGEKSPLLNIYRLVQANPVPFINLFFLLIFFVNFFC